MRGIVTKVFALTFTLSLTYFLIIMQIWQLIGKGNNLLTGIILTLGYAAVLFAILRFAIAQSLEKRLKDIEAQISGSFLGGQLNLARGRTHYQLSWPPASLAICLFHSLLSPNMPFPSAPLMGNRKFWSIPCAFLPWLMVLLVWNCLL